MDQLTPHASSIEDVNRCLTEIVVRDVLMKVVLVPDNLWYGQKIRQKVVFHYNALASVVISNKEDLQDARECFPDIPVINIDHNTTKIWDTAASHKLFLVLRETGFL